MGDPGAGISIRLNKRERSRMPLRNSRRKKSGGKKPSSRRRWVAKVKTDSTHPPEGLFKRDAETIARTKNVSPKGPGSGMRMLTYYINRGGKGLSTGRRKELERAQRLLSERIRKEKERHKAA